MGSCRRHPNPTIFPAESAGRAEMLAGWADHYLFADALGLVFGLHGDRFPPELHADRARFTAGKYDRWDSVRMKARVPDLRAQFAIHLALLEQALGGGRAFLAGASLSVADLAAYHPLWYARGNLGDEAGLDAYPNIGAWLARLDAIGHGTMEEMTPEAALAIARDAGPATVSPSSDIGTFRIGMRLTVIPDDWGFDPVEGELVAIDRDSIAIRRDDALIGTVHVHFPRLLDEQLELRRGQRAGLLVDEHAVADHHQGGDGRDAVGGGEVALRLGVDLREGDVGVSVGCCFVDGRERAAGAAPLRPEVDEHDAVASGCRAERLGRQIRRRHGPVTARRGARRIRGARTGRPEPPGGCGCRCTTPTRARSCAPWRRADRSRPTSSSRTCDTSSLDT